MADDQTTASSDERLSILIANHRRFLDFLSARVRDRHVAEEILQNAFVRSVQKGASIRDEESVLAWFYRVLRNALIDHYRANASHRRSLDSVDLEALESEPAMDIEMERTLCACIHDLIPLLKPEYAEIVRLVDLGETAISSAAETLGITPGNARVRLHRARAALRSEVERSCRTCATHGCLDCTCSKSQGKTCG